MRQLPNVTTPILKAHLEYLDKYGHVLVLQVDHVALIRSYTLGNPLDNFILGQYLVIADPQVDFVLGWSLALTFTESVKIPTFLASTPSAANTGLNNSVASEVMAGIFAAQIPDAGTSRTRDLYNQDHQ
jgi:hypothetical protein